MLHEMKHANTLLAEPAVTMDAAHTARTVSTAAARSEETLQTSTAAALMGFTVGTLRNYVWLQSLTRRERIQRGLQDPPEGLPQPKRKRGRLLWPAHAVRRFAENKPK